MDKEHLALEADRLSKDPVFLEVLARIRAASVEKLINTPVDKTTDIIHLQCFARICDIFPAELQAMIKSSKDPKPKPVV